MSRLLKACFFVLIVTSVRAEASFFSLISDLLSSSGSGSSGSSGSGSSGSSGPGSGIGLAPGQGTVDPNATLIYIPPAQPYVYRTIPLSSITTMGTTVASLDQEMINLQQYSVCKNVDNKRPAEDKGLPEELESGVFIPYQTQEEWDQFAANPPEGVTLSDCGSIVVAVGVPGQWVQVLNYSESPEAACGRMGVAPYGGTGMGGLGVCAADESAPGPGSGEGWELIKYPNNLHHLSKSIIYKQKQGGTIISQSGRNYFCYKNGQKKDNDLTDRVAAYLCTLPP